MAKTSSSFVSNPAFRSFIVSLPGGRCLPVFPRAFNRGKGGPATVGGARASTRSAPPYGRELRGDDGLVARGGVQNPRAACEFGHAGNEGRRQRGIVKGQVAMDQFDDQVGLRRWKQLPADGARARYVGLQRSQGLDDGADGGGNSV